MNTKPRVIGVQIRPEPGNKKVNLEKARNFIEQYAWFKPDLVVLPEVFNSGVDHNDLCALAEHIPDGPTTGLMMELAKKLNTNIVAGSYVEKKPGGDCKNTSIVIDRQGEIIARYEKVHLFNYHGSEESKFVTEGSKAVLVETDIGKIGLSICFDVRFPELYRALTFAGAEIITNVAAFPYPKLDHWVTLNKARAIENLAYVVTVNQCGRVNIKRQNLGMSMVINPWGEVVASVGGEEGVMMAEIDLEMLRRTRQEFSVLEDIRPHAYQVEISKDR